MLERSGKLHPYIILCLLVEKLQFAASFASKFPKKRLEWNGELDKNYTDNNQWYNNLFAVQNTKQTLNVCSNFPVLLEWEATAKTFETCPADI